MTDTSREIFDQYFGRSGRYVCVTMKDGEILIGKFIGFFRGNEDQGEPFIFRWRFLEKKYSMIDSDRTLDPEQGIFIEHSEIESVTFFKEP